MSFFGKFKSTSAQQNSINSQPKKDPAAIPPTLLEKHIADAAGPTRPDGSDKFFGFENYGSTCYCNSMLQCLYYSTAFRESVMNFPGKQFLQDLRSRSREEDVTIPRSTSTTPYPNLTSPARKEAAPQSPGANVVKLEDNRDSPEYKKKQAIKAGPVLAMTADHSNKYSMDESLFTSMKEIFEAVIENDSRLGVVSPHRFLEILRREKEEFRSAIHQDAHEFLIILLNEVIQNVEMFAKQHSKLLPQPNGSATESKGLTTSDQQTPGLDTRWVHDLFEGLLTSETRCLTCENTSQRDEEFLDLSVDLEPHTSVSSCLRKYSEEEMLCERNKFHCDKCGGLQEAEKRMKIKRLPRILALHLKRFKYTEDLQRLQKVFHRVVYPFYLRLFNTTDDAEDPQRLYELYAVVVHIGGGPYHGHYVSIIKTQDRGWLLFDDELVEPVDKSYVLNFFGGELVPGLQDMKQLACAYVLFYQETTLEAMLREQEMEGQFPAAAAATARASDVEAQKDTLYHAPTATTPLPEDLEQFEPLRQARTEPVNGAHMVTQRDPFNAPTTDPLARTKSRKEVKIEEKERKAREKSEKKLEEEKRKARTDARLNAWRQQQEELRRVMEESKITAAEETKKRGDENATRATEKGAGLSRFRIGSMSLRSKPKFMGDDKHGSNGVPAIPQTPKIHEDDLDLEKTTSPNPGVGVGEEKKFLNRFSLGRKRSQALHQG